jgi:hypothetical protein
MPGTPFNTQGTQTPTEQTTNGSNGFLGGFDFNDIIAAAVVWNGYRKK